MLTASILAKRTNVPLFTVRYYTRIGLLKPSRDLRNGYKIYKSSDAERLRFISAAKELGFTLAEIRELFNLYDLARDEKRQLQEFITKLEKRRALLEQQREDIEVMLNEITFFESQCKKLLAENPAQPAAA